MHLSTDGVRPSVRLALEALEARTLPSANVPAPTLPPTTTAVHTTTSTTVEVDYAHAATATTVKPAAVATASFAYHWSVGPSAVLVGTSPATGSGRSTGSVAFALVRDSSEAVRLGGPAGAVPIGFVVTSSSADPSKPDHFHASFSLSLKLKDAASGATGVVTFKGTVTGTLTWTSSALVATFLSPTTQKITLGSHVYTVSLPSKITPDGPFDAPTPLYAHIQVSNAPR